MGNTCAWKARMRIMHAHLPAILALAGCLSATQTTGMLCYVCSTLREVHLFKSVAAAEKVSRFSPADLQQGT